MRKTALLLDSTHLQIDHGPYSHAEMLHITKTPPYCNRVWLAAWVLKSPWLVNQKSPTRGNAAHCTPWQRAYRTFECSSLSLRHCLNSQTIKYPNKKKFYWMQKLCKHSIWRVLLTDSWKSSYRKSSKSTGLGRPLRKLNQIQNEIILRELNTVPRSA